MTGADQNSSLGLFRPLRWLMLGAIPLTALLYAASWNRMPERIATHFGMNGEPNGWMTREQSLMFSLVLTTVLATVGALILTRVTKPDVLSWGGLGLCYFVLGTVVWGAHAIITYNVSGHAPDSTPIVVIAVVTIGLSLMLALFTRPSSHFPATRPFAEETHASHAFAFVMALPCAAFAVLASKIPLPAARIGLAAASVVMLGAVVMAWSGFQYVFSKSGLEIRMLGFHLRSIPVAEIRGYAVARWGVLGGYGIRGIGNKRAYVWGNSGVRIKTTEGEVFLGHSEPGRIIRDLNAITNLGAHEDARNA